MLFKVKDNNKGSSKEAINFERLIFVKPRHTIGVSLETNQLNYEPGDLVDLNV